MRFVETRAWHWHRRQVCILSFSTFSEGLILCGESATQIVVFSFRFDAKETVNPIDIDDENTMNDMSKVSKKKAEGDMVGERPAMKPRKRTKKEKKDGIADIIAACPLKWHRHKYYTGIWQAMNEDAYLSLHVGWDEYPGDEGLNNRVLQAIFEKPEVGILCEIEDVDRES